MSLQFIGETGIYLPARDAVKVTAIAGDGVIDCYILRSALEALGCSSSSQPLEVVQKFEARRLDCEIAAMIKFRRSTRPLLALEVSAVDLAAVDRPRAA